MWSSWKKKKISKESITYCYRNDNVVTIETEYGEDIVLKVAYTTTAEAMVVVLGKRMRNISDGELVMNPMN